MYYPSIPLSTPISLLGDAHRHDQEHKANAESGNRCYGRLLKKANSTQTVMPNSFRHLMNSTHQETLKQVQGDKKSFSTACSNVNQAHQRASIISYQRSSNIRSSYFRKSLYVEAHFLCQGDQIGRESFWSPVFPPALLHTSNKLIRYFIFSPI